MTTKPIPKPKPTFVADIEEIRKRARQHILDGAVTGGYKGDRQTVIKVLNEALATEIVCVLRYKRHHYTAKGIHSQAVAEEFLEHANEEQGHADRIAERIVQLDGDPDLNPEGLASRSHSQYVEGDTLVDMIREDLIAERIAIESYSEIVRYLGDNDPTSRRLMEDILANEEEHAEEMKTLLESIGQDEERDEKKSERKAASGAFCELMRSKTCSYSRLKRYPKGDPNANSPAGDSHFAVAWCASHVAIQLRMGLLPQRRNRSRPADHRHSGAYWPAVNGAAVSQIATGGGLPPR